MKRSIKIPNIFIIGFLLFSVCLITYSNSLNNDFMLDDQGLILNDKLVHNPKFILYQFIPDKSYYLKYGPPKREVYYRPLAHIVPMLSYLMFKENPWGHHVINLILFWLCCLSIYKLITILLSDRTCALWTSLFFAVHPINGLFVNYITASVFAVQILAMSWASIAFLKAIENKDKGIRFYILGGLGYGIACLCHETAIILPLYLFCILYILKRYTFRQSAIKCIPYFILLILIMMLRMKFASLKISILNKADMFNMNIFEYIASFTRIMLWYISQLFYPRHIVIIWATEVIRKYVLFWNILFAAIILCIGFLFHLRKLFPKQVWAVSWLIVGFLPVGLACLFQPTIGFMIEPHWLFFPSIGFFVLVACGIQYLSKFIRKSLVVIFVIILLMNLIVISRAMNDLWSNEEKYCRYWQNNVDSDFKSIKFYLASYYYLKMKKYDLAREYFQQSLENKFSDWEIYNNIGLIAFNKGDIDTAVINYNKALRISSQLAIVWNNLGSAYLKTGRSKLAKEAFKKSISIHRFYLEPRLNLADMYLGKGDTGKAERLWLDNLNIDPNNDYTLSRLIRVYLNDSRIKKASEMGELLLQKTQNDSLLIEAGSLFADHDQVELADAFYRKAQQINPQNKDVYLEWGKLFGNLRKFETALSLWQEGSRLAPEDQQFLDLIKKAQNLSNQ